MQEEREREREPEATPEPAPEYKVTAKDVEQGVCPECHGADGHHMMDCEFLKSDGVDDVDLELHGLGEKADLPDGHYDLSEESPEELDVEIMSGKLPPSVEALLGSDMLWLIAKLAHEVNRQFCAGVMNDFSHKPWDDAPDWQRHSVHSGVVHYLENPGLTPEQSHSAWMEYKLANGWTYGNVKDERAKTHPNLIAFPQLHIHERAKDAIFTAICKTMLGTAQED